MWEMASIVEVFERRGLYDLITESRGNNPLGRIIEVGQWVTKRATHEQDAG